MPTLFLFPGAHKTGTSYLQKALEVCRPRIESLGFGVAKRGRYYADLHEQIRMPIEELAERVDETRTRMKGVFGVDNLDKDLILSVENLFGEFSTKPYRATRKVLRNLRHALPDHRLKCVFYIRRQDTFLESNYVQTIHKGQDWNWEEFWAHYKDVNLNWFEIIQPAKRNLNPQDFVLKPFESLKRGERLFLQEFFEQIEGLPTDEFVEVCAGNLKDTNLSLSTLGMDIVRSGFPLLESRLAREKYARHMQSLYGVDTGERFKMPDELRQKIAETYRDENRRLLRRHNCAGGVLDHYLFNSILSTGCETGMIFVTGGAGFIGSNLVAHFCDRGDRVLVCDRLGSDNVKWRNLAKHPIEGVIAPDHGLAELEAHSDKIDAVIHMGAISATTERDGDAIIKNNFKLSRDLWEWCARNAVPFVYASSAATYGGGEHGFSDSMDLLAHSNLRPLNLYGWSKKLFDVWVLKSIARGDPTPPQWAGLKFFNVYGPNELHKGDMMSLVSKNHLNCLQGQTVNLFRSHNPDYSDGGQLRDFVYVQDCVDVIDWLLAAPRTNRIFNMGSGQARSFYDLIDQAFKASNQDTLIQFIDMPSKLRGSYQYFTKADLSGLRAAGYTKPMTSLETGVKDLIAGYLQHSDKHR